MKTRSIAIALIAALFSLVLFAPAASADHTKGKKYLNIELTRDAAIAADDGTFGAAPEGTSGSGAMYLNVGQNRFCLFLDLDAPEGVSFAALHLHEKDATSDNPQTGPVVIEASSLLTEDGSAGCVTADREFLRGVLSTPDEYYINAHISDLSVIRADIGQN